jgi:hypothetical membrane protein
VPSIDLQPNSGVVTGYRARVRSPRWSTVAGLAGPGAFVTAWVVAGARTPGYDPVDTAISRLAQHGAPHRPLMTAGMVAFGLATPAFALLARRRLTTPVTAALLWAGAGTLAVAALPLHPGEDSPAHAIAAVAAYAGTAAAPWLTGTTVGRAVGASSALLLVASFLGPATGLFQRAGLTVVDVWIVATALRTPVRAGAPT